MRRWRAAASLPSCTACTVRSSPVLVQSPPANTPLAAGRRSPCSTATLPSSSASPARAAFPQSVWPTALSTMSAGDRDALAGLDKLALRVELACARIRPRSTWPPLPLIFCGASQSRTTTPLLLASSLFVGGGAHLLRAAAIDHGHFVGAEQLALDRRVDGRVAAADHHHALADARIAAHLGLAQLFDEIDRVGHALEVLAGDGQARGSLPSPIPRNTASYLAAQLVELHLRPSALP